MYGFLICVVLCFFGCANTLEIGLWPKFGLFRMVLNNFLDCDRDKNLNLDVNDIKVYFYDFSQNREEIFAINDAAKGILSINSLNTENKFIFYVGGFTSHINKHSEERMRDAFRDLLDSYLIIFDHSTYTNDQLGYKRSYERSVRHVHYIGKSIGNMLASLSKGGVSPKLMHCIGLSLGSQMLASAGDAYINATGDKIWRITALDPAGPCFARSDVQEQIRSGLAEYVEVYHCNAGTLGTDSILGDVDFFINSNGVSQPNCGTPIIPRLWRSVKAATCSHASCVHIYATTVRHAGWFPAWKCDSYKMFANGHCPNEQRTVAGFWNPGTARGVYYFSTEGYLLD